MLIATRSRVRSALTVFALLLTLAVVVGAILFALNRAFPAQTHTYQSYQLALTPSPPWHARQSMTLQWVPSTAQLGPSTPPRTITCHFQLYGPYPTSDAAQADQFNLTAPLAASAPPLTLSTDVAAVAPTPVIYTLPAGLTPGYYLAVGLVASEDAAGGGSSSSWVAQLTA